MVLGTKVAALATVAVSIGGVMSVSAIGMITMGVLMKNSINKKYLGVWCGVALLRRPGGSTPPFESQHLNLSRPLPKSSAGGSIPPLRTILANASASTQDTCADGDTQRIARQAP